MSVALAKVMGYQLLDLTGINQEKMQVVHNRYLFDDKKIKQLIISLKINTLKNRLISGKN